MTTPTVRSRAKKPRPRSAPSRPAAGEGHQVNIRFSDETRRWLEEHAGGKRAVPAFVRDLVERERAAEREQELLAMFNRAAEDLTEEDREERRLFMAAHPNRD
jgi:hypothetical protein